MRADLTHLLADAPRIGNDLDEDTEPENERDPGSSVTPAPVNAGARVISVSLLYVSLKSPASKIERCRAVGRAETAKRREGRQSNPRALNAFNDRASLVYVKGCCRCSRNMLPSRPEDRAIFSWLAL
jgi:hypothetical protein